MFRIGEFSKLTKTTIKTLRYYDKIGLLKPAFVDSATSYRYYTEEQIEMMGAILSYKNAGLPNDEITKILHGSDADTVLLAQRERLAKAVSDIGKQIAEIDRMLSHIARQEYSATLKTVNKSHEKNKRNIFPDIIGAYLLLCFEGSFCLLFDKSHHPLKSVFCHRIYPL